MLQEWKPMADGVEDAKKYLSYRSGDIPGTPLGEELKKFTKRQDNSLQMLIGKLHGDERNEINLLKSEITLMKRDFESIRIRVTGNEDVIGSLNKDVGILKRDFTDIEKIGLECSFKLEELAKRIDKQLNLCGPIGKDVNVLKRKFPEFEAEQMQIRTFVEKHMLENDQCYRTLTTQTESIENEQKLTRGLIENLKIDNQNKYSKLKEQAEKIELDVGNSLALQHQDLVAISERSLKDMDCVFEAYNACNRLKKKISKRDQQFEALETKVIRLSRSMPVAIEKRVGPSLTSITNRLEALSFEVDRLKAEEQEWNAVFL